MEADTSSKAYEQAVRGSGLSRPVPPRPLAGASCPFFSSVAAGMPACGEPRRRTATRAAASGVGASLASTQEPGLGFCGRAGCAGAFVPCWRTVRAQGVERRRAPTQSDTAGVAHLGSLLWWGNRGARCAEARARVGARLAREPSRRWFVADALWPQPGGLVGRTVGAKRHHTCELRCAGCVYGSRY